MSIMSVIVLEYVNGASIGVIVVIAFISYYLLRKDPRNPPEAEGGWPVIGHLRLLGSSSEPHKILAAMADKYGPIYRIRIGVHPAVVVSSWELAKECFTTLDAVVSSRPKTTAAKILGYDYANFGFTPYGPLWREMRKIANSELLSTRRVEMFQPIRDSEVRSSLEEIYRTWTRNGSGSGYVRMDMKKWFGDTNLNVILRTITGKTYSGEDANEKELRQSRKAFREFFRLTGLFVVGDAIPFLKWLDLGGHVRDMKKAAIEMDQVISGWLEEHRQKRNSSSDDAKAEHDFIDVLMSVLDQADLDGYDADTVNKATCSMIIAGATDTTAVTMTWALSLLLNNRDALKKVQQELETEIGNERLVNESDIHKLVYLQAVVKETLRLYPAGPLSGPREFTEDCTLGGYHIRGGTRLMLNVWKLHRDPRVWSEALKFKPERFLKEHKEIELKGQNFELIPFGGGRRACPGIPFALQMTHLALAAVLQAYEVTTPNDEKVDMNATFGLTAIKTTPLEVLLKPRLSPSLYQ